MTQISYFWEGIVTGDATSAPYDNDEFSDFIGFINHFDRRDDGVIFNARPTYNTMLEVVNPAGATARVSPGVALVDGKLYVNTANVDNTVSGNAVYWVVGLVKDFAAQTVRVFARGNYATRALALASLQQNDGTDWEIPLATILTTAGGAVSTITDERYFIPPKGTMRLIKRVITDVTEGASVDFVSIPAYFSHLKMFITAQSDDAAAVDYIELRFNSDAGANYNSGYHWRQDLGGTQDDFMDFNQGETEAIAGKMTRSGAGTFSQVEIDIFNYSRTDIYKELKAVWATPTDELAFDNYGTAFASWQDTSAIDRITLYAGDPAAPDNWASGCILDLYGIF